MFLSFNSYIIVVQCPFSGSLKIFSAIPLYYYIYKKSFEEELEKPILIDTLSKPAMGLAVLKCVLSILLRKNLCTVEDSYINKTILLFRMKGLPGFLL